MALKIVFQMKTKCIRIRIFLKTHQTIVRERRTLRKDLESRSPSWRHRVPIATLSPLVSTGWDQSGDQNAQGWWQRVSEHQYRDQWVPLRGPCDGHCWPPVLHQPPWCLYDVTTAADFRLHAFRQSCRLPTKTPPRTRKSAALDLGRTNRQRNGLSGILGYYSPRFSSSQRSFGKPSAGKSYRSGWKYMDFLPISIIVLLS